MTNRGMQKIYKGYQEKNKDFTKIRLFHSDISAVDSPCILLVNKHTNRKNKIRIGYHVFL